MDQDPSQDDRYSGDLARFIALNIASVGGGKIDMDSLPSLHGGWDLAFINRGGLEMDIRHVSYSQLESLLTHILGKPFFRGGGETDLRSANFASNNFDCEIKLTEEVDSLHLLIH